MPFFIVVLGGLNLPTPKNKQKNLMKTQEFFYDSIRRVFFWIRESIDSVKVIVRWLLDWLWPPFKNITMPNTRESFSPSK